ncbi:FAD-binding oxidoreductase [Saccharothrix sp. Mg75]|uniref:FAD-binding oxidoreductase n=1 Tax=Saccharothrix sp. Mg75 TaxID=3445357 RepID=UPI003EE842EA
MTTTRRRLLLGGAATGAALAAGGIALPGTAAARTPSGPRVGRDAPQYADLVRGVNQRWVGNPAEVWVARSTDDVVDAVAAAVRGRTRIAVRSGGHCFEDFSANGEIGTLVDLSALDTVEHDPAARAFAVGAGARLGDVYAELFKGWGVTVPGGSCPTVGLGGHVAGGGYGPLNRRFGLVVDHLHAVEVVVATRGGARRVVATRDPGDPHRDLWWAHTGGGGGNFGVVTKYWFRSPRPRGWEPSRLLPSPPAEVLVATVVWPWARLDERAFVRLVRNYSAWFAATNAPGAPEAGLYAHLAAFHASGGAVALNVQVDAGTGNADALLDRFLAAVDDGVGVPGQTTERRRLPWLMSTQWAGFADRPTGKRIKGKSAMHRGALSERAAAALFRNLTREDYAHPGSGVLIAPYGGQVNAVAANETASPHRDCSLTLLYVSEWVDPAQDDLHVDFQRRLYRDVYAETGGVPAVRGDTGGAYVNYPDADLLDPAWNTSGVPWQWLYYREGYAKLRRVKAEWDGGDVFRHRMSVEPAGGR